MTEQGKMYTSFNFGLAKMELNYLSDFELLVIKSSSPLGNSSEIGIPRDQIPVLIDRLQELEILIADHESYDPKELTLTDDEKSSFILKNKTSLIEARKKYINELGKSLQNQSVLKSPFEEMKKREDDFHLALAKGINYEKIQEDLGLKEPVDSFDFEKKFKSTTELEKYTNQISDQILNGNREQRRQKKRIDKSEWGEWNMDELEKVTEQVFSKLFLLRDSIEAAERVHTPQEQSFLSIIDELELAIVKAEKEKEKIEKCVDAAFDNMMGKDKIDEFLDQGGTINIYPKQR